MQGTLFSAKSKTKPNISYLTYQPFKNWKKIIHDVDATATTARPECSCPTEVPLFLEIPEFPYNTAKDWWKEASMPKTQIN